MDGETYIDRPDEHGVGSAEEVYCWLNQDRECNGSCMAFRVVNDEPKCELLANLDSALSMLSAFLRGKATAERNQALTRAIEKIPNPPEVR